MNSGGLSAGSAINRGSTATIPRGGSLAPRINNGANNSSSFVQRNFGGTGGSSLGNRGVTANHSGGLNRNLGNNNFAMGNSHHHHHGDHGSHYHANHYPRNHYNNNSFFFGTRSPFGVYVIGRPRFGYGLGVGIGGVGFGGLGLGYGLAGYTDYGLGGFDYGYGSDFGYPYYGYDSAYSSSSFYGAPSTTDTGSEPLLPSADPSAGVDPDPVAGPSADGSSPDALDFAAQGESNFKSGNYKEAVRSFRHALVDDPTNGAYVLLLGQSLFATGQFDEAAGATQLATRMLPQEKWGAVVANYKEVYANVQDYTDQLRALERARDAKPDSPALRFLLGWHYGYLGFPKQSVRELNKVLELAPKDEVAQKLRDEMAGKLPKSDAPKAPPAKPAPPATPPGIET